ncbi:MAG: DNA/RNA nuclease SfsA [Clostridia bacterium]
MRYKNITEGIFLQRPNRFIANVLIDGENVVCHVKNTGRCKELLYEGVKVFLEKSDNPLRKTKYDLVSVYKYDVLYNIDSQAPNKVFGEYIDKFFNSVTLIKPECKYKNSRFDFYVEYENKKAFIEVKGVTLEKDNIMLFPDAPTERGVKHLNELCECINDGYEAYAVFIIQADAGEYFTPNYNTHPEFAKALKDAKDKGVNIKAFKCSVSKDDIEIKETMEVRV